jgi:hypothetical protein
MATEHTIHTASNVEKSGTKLKTNEIAMNHFKNAEVYTKIKAKDPWTEVLYGTTKREDESLYYLNLRKKVADGCK